MQCPHEVFVKHACTNNEDAHRLNVNIRVPGLPCEQLCCVPFISSRTFYGTYCFCLPGSHAVGNSSCSRTNQTPWPGASCNVALTKLELESGMPWVKPAFAFRKSPGLKQKDLEKYLGVVARGAPLEFCVGVSNVWTRSSRNHIGSV